MVQVSQVVSQPPQYLVSYLLSTFGGDYSSSYDYGAGLGMPTLLTWDLKSLLAQFNTGSYLYSYYSGDYGLYDYSDSLSASELLAFAKKDTGLPEIQLLGETLCP